MNLFELFVKIGVEDKASPAMKNTQKNSETLTNKIKVMSAQFDAAQKNVDKLTKEFNDSVAKTGAASKETQELAKKLDNAEKEAENKYVGVSCGKLDQSCEIYSRKNSLLYMDLKDFKTVQHIQVIKSSPLIL